MTNALIPAAAPSAPATMTSLELVEFINASRKDGEVELRHDHFMPKVPKVLGETIAPKFLGTNTYVNGRGGKQTRSIYIFPKREACLMAMSYSYELQAKVFDRMTALEGQVVAPVAPAALPTSFAAALRLAAEQAEKMEQQAAQIEVMKPMATVGALVARHQHTLNQVARTLPGVNTTMMKSALAALGYFYRQHKVGSYRRRAEYKKFFEERFSDNYGTFEIFPTPAGRALLVDLYVAGKLPMCKGRSPVSAAEAASLITGDA